MDKKLKDEFRKITRIESIEQAARAVYKALCDYCERCGVPTSEVHIKTPEESLKHGVGCCWYVCFEAGEYQWAIGASFILSGPHWYTEPFYSFDLCFEQA